MSMVSTDPGTGAVAATKLRVIWEAMLALTTLVVPYPDRHLRHRDKGEHRIRLDRMRRRLFPDHHCSDDDGVKVVPFG